MDFCCICSTWEMVLFAGTELWLWDLGFWWCCLLGQWHSHIPKTWLLGYSNPSTDHLPLVSHAYDLRTEVHVEQNILKVETKQWTNWYTLLTIWWWCFFVWGFFFYVYCANYVCIHTVNCLLFDNMTWVFTAACSTCNICESVFLHPFTFLCLCISVPVVNQLLVSSSYSYQLIASSDFINFSVS